MPKNRTKVESRAIDIIRDIVDDHPRLLPDPSFGDKGISFDGYIQLFKNEDVDKKENLLRQIPIQIKGRTEKNKKKVFMISGRKESVETDDIQNYYKHGGVIFFFVLFDKEFKEHSVFYSVLMPVKCKRYLELASTEKRKRIPVTFERMEETGNKMYELCAQFHAEQNKQGFGGGVLMEHVVNWGDLKGETTLTVSAVGAKSIDEILKRVVRGDVHFYAKEGSFSVPVAWREDSRFLKIIPYEHPVMIGKNKYFEHLNVGIDVNTKEHCLYLGNAITIEVSTAKFTLKKRECIGRGIGNCLKFSAYAQ